MLSQGYIAVIVVFVVILIFLLCFMSSSNARGTIRKRRRDGEGRWRPDTETDGQHRPCDAVPPTPYGRSPPKSSVPTRTAAVPDVLPSERESLSQFDSLVIWGTPSRYASFKVTYSLNGSSEEKTVYNTAIQGKVARPVCWILTSNKALIEGTRAKLLEDPDFDKSSIVRTVALTGKFNVVSYDIDDDQNTLWSSGVYTDSSVGRWEPFNLKKVELQSDDIAPL